MQLALPKSSTKMLNFSSKMTQNHLRRIFTKIGRFWAVLEKNWGRKILAGGKMFIININKY